MASFVATAGWTALAILLFSIISPAQLVPPRNVGPGTSSTYSGRVVDSSTAKPLAGVTVALYPCHAVSGWEPLRLVQQTGAGGTWKFADLPWPHAFVVVAHPGFAPIEDFRQCQLSAVAVSAAQVTVPPERLRAVLSPIQMDRAAVARAYPKSSQWVHFRDATFSPDAQLLSRRRRTGQRNKRVELRCANAYPANGSGAANADGY